MQQRPAIPSSLVEYLRSAWLNMTGVGDVVSLWNYNPIDWILYEPSLVNNMPLKKFLRSLIFTDIKRNVAVGSSDINEGVFKIFKGD